MSVLELVVRREALTHNARAAVELCGGFGIEVMSIVKSIGGRPDLVAALRDGGVPTIGEARLRNLIRLREAGDAGSLWLIRSPGLSEIDDCLAHATGSLQSDPDALDALAEAAAGLDAPHEVLLMVDLETGREGFPPDRIAAACRRVQDAPGLALRGVGVYFEFNGDQEFHAHGLHRLADLVGEVAHDTGIVPTWVSGGSTSIVRTHLLPGRRPPAPINHLRLGTSVLLGIASSIGPQPIPGFRQDTFELRAEVIELKRGPRPQAILALGKLDADPDYLFPMTDGVRIVSASSDHTVVDLADVADPPRVGDHLSFRLGYYALCRLDLDRMVDIRHE